MSFQQIIASSAIQLEEALRKVDSGTIVAIVDPNTQTWDDTVNNYFKNNDTGTSPKYPVDSALITETFLNDDKIGFIFTDLQIETEGIRHTKYLNSNNLYSVPFFLRKPNSEINLKEGDIKTQVMQQMIAKGYSFEHFATPLFCNSVG